MTAIVPATTPARSSSGVGQGAVGQRVTVVLLERAEDGVLLPTQDAKRLLLLADADEHVIGGAAGVHDEVGQSGSTREDDLSLDDPHLAEMKDHKWRSQPAEALSTSVFAFCRRAGHPTRVMALRVRWHCVDHYFALLRGKTAVPSPSPIFDC